MVFIDTLLFIYFNFNSPALRFFVVVFVRALTVLQHSSTPEAPISLPARQ